MGSHEDGERKYNFGDGKPGSNAKHQDLYLDSKSINDSGFGEKQGEGTCVEEEVIANLRLEREKESLDAEFDLDVLFNSLGFHKLLYGFNCSHDDDQ